MLPGTYSIKFLARDAETGRIGTYETSFNIPDLNMVKKRLAISSVILSSQSINLKQALYNAVRTEAKEEAVNPLVQNGEKLIPSVTRVFRHNQDLYVYLQAYQQDAPKTRPLVAYVSFYRGGNFKEYETTPIEVTDGWKNELRTTPTRFRIPLAHLERGRYQCQVTILDPNSDKVAFWRAPILIIQ